MTTTDADILGEAVETAFREQERTIGVLPAGSTVLELPPWARWLIVHPTEPPKAITWDGKLCDLASPSIRHERKQD